MAWWQAIVLGIVEGITEYLPVSSTGHLLLAQRAMGIPQTAASDAYAICIQAGAILAVLGLYARRVVQIIRGVLGRDEAGRRLAIALFVALLPLVPIAILEKQIKHSLFGLWQVTAAWLVGGIVILAVSRWLARRSDHRALELTAITWKLGLAIGVAQCVAVWPGTSRSMVTILAGVLVGLSLSAAVEFSFLLGGVTLTGATLLDARKHGAVMLQSYGVPDMLLGFLVAAVCAAIAIQWMVAYLTRHGMDVFGYYRIGLSLVVAALILMGVLVP